MTSQGRKQKIAAITFKVFEKKKEIISETFDQNKIVIGRIQSADFKIEHASVSRIHALVEQLEDGNIRISDLNSSHGTFVNGEKITEKILNPDDKIQLADLEVLWSRVVLQDPVAITKTLEIAQTLEPESRREALRVGAPEVLKNETLKIDAQGAAVFEPSFDKAPAKLRSQGEGTQVRELKKFERSRGVLEVTQGADSLEFTVFWEETLLAVDHFPLKEKIIKIGEGEMAQYIVPRGTLGSVFDFVRITDSGCEVRLHPLMKGSFRMGGKHVLLADLIQTQQKSVFLGRNDLAKIQIGDVNFFLLFVSQPPVIPAAPVFEFSLLISFIFGFLILSVGAFFVFAFLFREPIQGRVVEFPEKLRKILIEEYQKDIEIKKVETQPEPVLPPAVEKPKVEGKVAKKAETVPDAQVVAEKAQRGGNEGEGAKERGVEGKRGKPEAKAKTGITNRPKVADAKKTFDARTKTKRVNKEPGETASLVDSLKNTGLGARLAKAAGAGSGGGEGGGAQGQDPLDVALSGVGGGGVRDGQGVAGASGLSGTGTGGGGKAVGVGGLGTEGFGGGAKGTGAGSIPGKGEAVVGTESLEVIVLGSLSREEIERVVNAHRNEVRFCYQRELLRDPTLAGKITLQWTIVTGGRVELAKVLANSTGSASLANCIRDRLVTWQFPSPRGGSKAVVDWPYSLKPPGT